MKTRKFLIMVTGATATMLSLVGPLIARTDQGDIARMLANRQVTVTNTPIDIGAIKDVFDGDPKTLARTRSINPMIVTLRFASPKQLFGSRVWFSAGGNRWRIETADSVADMDTAGGTFQVALDWATDDESGWRERSFTKPITCRVIRLTLQRLTGDSYVHLNEWQPFFRGRGVDASKTR